MPGHAIFIPWDGHVSPHKVLRCVQDILHLPDWGLDCRIDIRIKGDGEGDIGFELYHPETGRPARLSELQKVLLSNRIKEETGVEKLKIKAISKKKKKKRKRF